jgi:hypothetical protein
VRAWIESGPPAVVTAGSLGRQHSSAAHTVMRNTNIFPVLCSENANINILNEHTVYPIILIADSFIFTQTNIPLSFHHESGMTASVVY